MKTLKFRNFSYKNKSLFIKFFLGVLLVSVFSVIIITLILFFWFNNKTTQDINKINKMELMNIETIFNNHITMSQNFSMELYENPILKSLIYSDEFEWSDDAYNAISQSKSLISVNRFINSVYVFNKNGVVFNVSTKPEDASSQKELFNIVKSKTVAQSPVIWNMKRINGENIKTLTVFFHDGIGTYNCFDGAVAVNIDLEELKNVMFSKQSINKQNVLILNDDKQIVIQLIDDGKQQEKTNKPYLDRIYSSKETSDVFNSYIDNVKTSVCYVKSNSGKFCMVSEMDYKKRITELISARNITIGMCFFIIALIIALSLLVTYVIYRPVGIVLKKIRNMFMDSSVISKKMNEIQLVSSTINRIVDKMNSLEKENDNNSIVKVITSSRDTMETNVSDLLLRGGCIYETGADYCVVVIRIDDFNSFKNKNSADAISFQIDSLCTISAEFINQIAFSSAYKIADDTVVIVISQQYQKSPLEKNIVKELMVEIQNMILKIVGISVSLGISNITNDISSISDRYKEAYNFTKYRLFYGYGNIFFEDLFEKDNTSQIYMLIQDAIGAVKNFKQQSYEELLKQIIEDCKYIKYDKAIKSLTHFAEEIIRFSKDIINEKPLNKDMAYIDIYQKIDEFGDVYELKGWFMQLYYEATSIMSDINNKGIHDTVIEAIEYIDSHYWEQQLSINVMAEKLSISPWYFSRIFNEVCGCSFPDYVSKLRLDKAKDMLTKNTDININDIAQKVGYSSSTYFTTSFKKKFGVTPSKWRMNYYEV